MGFSKLVVKLRRPILIIALLAMIPSVLGMAATRINYDMLTYLPSDMDTVIGQDLLMDEFGKGAFTMIVVEGMDDKQTAALKEELESVEHVDTVLWYDTLADLSIPKEMLPDRLYKEFNSENATLMAVFFDTSTSEDATIAAVTRIRQITGEKAFVAGLTAMVLDLRELCEREEPIYVAIAVVLAALAMMIFLDGWLVPFVFLASIGMAILINLGTNYFLGEVSYITKALSAVLQLAVTMDYSIFLWHSYNEQLATHSDRNEAMALAISETLTSVVGSSVTTIAGFAALCFMSFTLGRDLGIVMAKGVMIGVVGCVTILPSMILALDTPLQKTKHRSLLPDMKGLANGVTKVFPIFLILFVVLIPPSYYGYSRTNEEVYYDLGATLPEDIGYMVANTKLKDEFDLSCTHMLLVDASVSPKNVSEMADRMEQVDGVKYVLGMDTLLDASIPREMIPDRLLNKLQSEHWKLLLINSRFKVASDEANAQVDALNAILKEYDENGMLIGEAPCMKDMIVTTNHDFQVVNTVSIIAIFVIILLVTRSLSLPVILISVIELAIFINMAIAHYLGESLPFIAPVVISTIQLGATVDYAILMTTRYKAERNAGGSKRESISIALSTSIPSIIVSGMGLFAATFGVALYSDLDIISSLCMLLARGAIISMLCVILILPALLMLCDGLIRHTTLGMRGSVKS